MCDVCKMLIKDELTQKLDRYNGTKLKRMYKLTDQDMLQLYKLCSCFGFVRWKCFRVFWRFAMCDRWIFRWIVRGCVKSFKENGILCVHVIGYKLEYKIIYKLEYGTRKNINKIGRAHV